MVCRTAGRKSLDSETDLVSQSGAPVFQPSRPQSGSTGASCRSSWRSSLQNSLKWHWLPQHLAVKRGNNTLLRGDGLSFEGKSRHCAHQNHISPSVWALPRQDKPACLTGAPDWRREFYGLYLVWEAVHWLCRVSLFDLKASSLVLVCFCVHRCWNLLGLSVLEFVLFVLWHQIYRNEK